MRVMRPLTVTEDGNTINFSNGYDTMSATKDQAESDDRYDGRSVWDLTWPRSPYCAPRIPDYNRTAANQEELYAIAEKLLLSPIEKPFTDEEFEDACALRGYIHGVIRITLSRLDAYELDSTIIFDLFGTGTNRKRIRAYKVVGFEDRVIYILAAVEQTDYR